MMLHRISELAREWGLRILGSFRARSDEADLREELSHHVELAEQRFLEQGHTPAEAARLARLRYGSADSALEDLRRQQGIPWFGPFTLDVRLGLRMMRKFLGITLIGGLAMTVGFSIIIAIFTFFDVVMWSDSVPLDEGERVMAVQVWDSEIGRRSEISAQDFDRWRTGLGSFEDIGAFRTVERGIVHENGEIESVPMAEMSASGFDLARVAPVLGRTLLEEDETEGAEPVVVIGYDEWQSRFNGDEGVIGQALRLNERFYTIVGVMPDDFAFPVNHQFWLPLSLSYGELIFAPPNGTVFARLATGVTTEEAQAELSAIGLLPSQGSPDRVEPFRLNVLHYPKNFLDDLEPGDVASQARNARLLMFFVSLLLVPPCVNIAMLVYARMVMRREEIAVRTALGASRGRIVVQLFIEMLILSAVAAGIALVLVQTLLSVVKGSFLSDLGRLPFWLDFRLSLDTLLLAAALAVSSALLIGLLPALGATRGYSRPGPGALNSRNGLRLGPVWTLLVIAQIAFSFAALPTAVELGWGVLRAGVLGPGFASEQYLTARLEFDSAEDLNLGEADYRTRRDLATRQFVDRIENDPRVQSRVALASAVPGEGAWARFRIEGEEALVGAEIASGVSVGTPMLRRIAIDDRYLETYGVDLLAGRSFAAGEFRSDSRSVLINATMAEDVFPGTNPLGRRIAYASPGTSQRATGQAATWYEIVGVVADRPAHPYGGSVFHAIDSTRPDSVSIGFRTEQTDEGLREELVDLAARIDPALELENVRTLREVYDDQEFENYLGGVVIMVVSLTVLALAAAGTCALMAFTVNQRRREIAIRMALGARPHKLLQGVFRSALQKLAIGAVLGVALASFVQILVPARMLGGLDVPGVLPGAAMLLILIGAVASFAPARRALRTDPAECLSDQA